MAGLIFLDGRAILSAELCTAGITLSFERSFLPFIPLLPSAVSDAEDKAFFLFNPSQPKLTRS